MKYDVKLSLCNNGEQTGEITFASCACPAGKGPCGSFDILDQASAENEIEWIQRIHKRYNKTIERIGRFTSTTERENNAEQNSALRLEKVKMPFSMEQCDSIRSLNKISKNR